MPDFELALAVNGALDDVTAKLRMLRRGDQTTASGDGPDRPGSVAVVGLGYVGLPTALALHSQGLSVVGVDISPDRIHAIRSGQVDLPDTQRGLLDNAVRGDGFRLTTDPTAVRHADAVVICVPTPIDRHRLPDLGPLQTACASVVRHARPGQVIVLTSTSFVGTTRELLIGPLARRGLNIGTDICVACSPERIDPGVDNHRQHETPRVIGADTPHCVERAATVVGCLTDQMFAVGSPEVAELAKLYENLFRAVNLALANEIADICGVLDLDPVEVTAAAATKPYGFLGCLPGPGVGGHCIPCDPHYLLWQLRQVALPTPLTELAMTAIAQRPQRVVRRTAEVLSEAGIPLAGARVVVVGVSYKPGVRDLRGSSAVEIVAGLLRRGVQVSYHDPLVPELRLATREVLHSELDPAAVDWDLALIHTLHPGVDYTWAADCSLVLDATYRFGAAKHREVV
ncbi:MAG TPA: nucleotide sugar dehydrogenase [Micromonosporaceae bacterium]|nr:nucleotide sugar dehydrogenase [Micromonosporaceae bacterium]